MRCRKANYACGKAVEGFPQEHCRRPSCHTKEFEWRSGILCESCQEQQKTKGSQSEAKGRRKPFFRGRHLQMYLVPVARAPSEICRRCGEPAIRPGFKGSIAARAVPLRCYEDDEVWESTVPKQLRGDRHHRQLSAACFQPQPQQLESRRLPSAVPRRGRFSSGSARVCQGFGPVRWNCALAAVTALLHRPAGAVSSKRRH